MTQTRPMLRQQEDRGFAQHDLLENSRNPSEQCLVRHRQCVFPTEQALDDAMPDRTRKREQVSHGEKTRGPQRCRIAEHPLRRIVQVLIERSEGKPSRSEEHTSELKSLMRRSYAVY